MAEQKPKQKVLVKLPKDHPYPFYRRAGLVLTPGENVLEVDEAQLAALKGDPKLLVGPVPSEPAKPAQAQGGNPPDRR
jgi:hypothetical protein